MAAAAKISEAGAEKVVGGGLARRPRLNYLTCGPSETLSPAILPCATLLFVGTILLRKFNFTLSD